MNHPRPMFMYRTKRLGLKRLDETELSGDYPTWFMDEEVNRYNSHFRRPESPSQVRAYVGSLDTDTTKLVFAVYWLADEVHVGNIALQRIDAHNQSAEMAFLFGHKSYWNRGIAFEASEIVVEHCHRHLNLRRLYLGCFPDNTAMCKLASKLGFKQEGRLKEAVFGNGRYNDIVLYGRLL